MIKRFISFGILILGGCSQNPQIHVQGVPDTTAKQTATGNKGTRNSAVDSMLPQDPKPEPAPEKCEKILGHWTKCYEGGWLSNTKVTSMTQLCFASKTREPAIEAEGRRWQETIYSDIDAVSEWDYERCQVAGQCPKKLDQSRPPDMVPNEPVLGVTQAGANAYCSGLGKRLPTPSEWAHLGGCGDNESTRILRCVDAVKPGKLKADSQKKTYARPYAKAVRNAYLSRLKKAGTKQKGDLCKRACRRGVPWLACDPHFADHYGHPPEKMATGFKIEDTYKGSERVEALLRG